MRILFVLVYVFEYRLAFYLRLLPNCTLEHIGIVFVVVAFLFDATLNPALSCELYLYGRIEEV